MNEQSSNQQFQEEESFSLKDFIIKSKPYLLKLWDKKWSFIGFNFFIGLVTVLYLLFSTDPYFKSNITILPNYGGESSGMLSRFSGLASMAGVNVGDAPTTQIYGNLVRSESVIKDVVYATYKTEKFQDSVNLIEYFEVEPSEELSAELNKRNMFLSIYGSLTDGRISTELERETNILNITVTMPEPKLAAEVANNIVESLNEYIITQRTSKASEQKEYLSERLKEVKDSLRIAENELKKFREQNRVVSQSPSLLLQQSRLRRKVEIKNTVFTELEKQYEMAKLNEIKDTPVLNIREKAENPIKKAGPSRKKSLIIIMFLSGTLSALFIMFSDNLKDYIDLIKE